MGDAKGPSGPSERESKGPSGPTERDSKGPYFHVGIVVADLDAAQAQLSELLGVTWGPVLDVPTYDVRDGAGQDGTVRMRMCYSAGAAPHLELIEEVPGTVWVCNEHSNLHHIGAWTGSFLADSERFATAACPMQTAGRVGDQSPVTFAYHGTDLGVRIELVDEDWREAISGLFQPPA